MCYYCGDRAGGDLQAASYTRASHERIDSVRVRAPDYVREEAGAVIVARLVVIVDNKSSGCRRLRAPLEAVSIRMAKEQDLPLNSPAFLS